VPTRPDDVVFRQRHDQLEIRARVAVTGLEQRPLEPPVRPVLLAFVAKTPELAEGWDRSARDREFVRTARPFPLEPFPEGSAGRTVELRRDVPIATFPEAAALVLALSIEDRRGRSLPSARQVLVPADPPLPPVGALDHRVLERGVELSWQPPEDERVERVRIYRRVDEEPFEPTPWRRPDASAGKIVDEAARFGQTLRYRFVAARVDEDVPVESAPRELGPIDYRDVFPPRPVVDLEAVPASGAIRVLWFPGGSPDEVAARVERQAEGETGFRAVGRVALPDADFTDTEVDPDRRYRYRVLAVDAAGNASTPAGPSGWVSPRPVRREPEP
jgi:hypothetical protein